MCPPGLCPLSNQHPRPLHKALRVLPLRSLELVRLQPSKTLLRQLPNRHKQRLSQPRSRKHRLRRHLHSLRKRLLLLPLRRFRRSPSFRTITVSLFCNGQRTVTIRRLSSVLSSA